jgi:hypothetical protein
LFPTFLWSLMERIHDGHQVKRLFGERGPLGVATGKGSRDSCECHSLPTFGIVLNKRLHHGKVSSQELCHENHLGGGIDPSDRLSVRESVTKGSR